MKSRLALAFFVLAACDGRAIVTTPVGVAPAVTRGCDGGGDFDLSAEGVDFAAFNGRRVWVSAVQSEGDQKPFKVVALVEGRIADGGFDLRCEQSLTKNYWYPATALLVDADDSGDCSVGDIQMTQQLYAWFSDVDFHEGKVTPAWMKPVEPTSLFLVTGIPFCAAFFDLDRS